MKQEYVDFNDQSIPIGKRKVAFVKWIMKRFKYSLDDAREYCYKKFYKEEHSQWDNVYQISRKDRRELNRV